jgi:hypothetical protein
VKLRVDRGFALFVFTLISFPKLQNSCGAVSFPARGAAGVGSGTRVAWWQAKKTKSRFFAQNPREEEAVLASLGMTGRRLPGAPFNPLGPKRKKMLG